MQACRKLIPLKVSVHYRARRSGCGEPNDGRGSDDLIRNADLASTRRKVGARLSAFFQATCCRPLSNRVLEEDLRDALEKGEIHVFYQPIVNPRNNLTTGLKRSCVGTIQNVEQFLLLCSYRSLKKRI